MSKVDQNLCIEAGNIHYSYLYNGILGLLVVVNIFGKILIFQAGLFVIRTRKICINLRMLLLSLSLAILFRTFCTSTRAMVRIIRAIRATDPCDFVTQIFYCQLENSIQSIPFFITLITLPMIAAERLMATVFRSIYERLCFKVLVFLSVIGGWIYSIVIHLNIILSATNLDMNVAYCSSIIFDTDINLTSVILDLQFLLPTGSLLICIGVYWFSKKQKEKFFKFRKASHSLNDRYNLDEIIRTSQIILFLCSVFCVLYILYQLVLVTSVMYYIDTVQRFSIVKEISSLCVMPVFANIYGITFWYMQRSAARRLSVIPKLQPEPTIKFSRKSVITPLATESDAYFSIYANSWK